MSVARTARRRRKQAVMNYMHIAPLRRPKYKKKDAVKSAKLMAKRIETERRMKQKKK